jgi:hypothetical protein
MFWNAKCTQHFRSAFLTARMCTIYNWRIGGAVKADSSRTNSELIFNKYGNRYFLEKLSDEGGLSVKLLGESGYEKRIGRAAAEAQEHVPAHHRGS